jgi:hypothetical protein
LLVGSFSFAPCQSGSVMKIAFGDLVGRKAQRHAGLPSVKRATFSASGGPCRASCQKPHIEVN